MPVINMPIDQLLKLVNVGGQAALQEADVSQTLHDMGVEVDELTQTKVFECRPCANVLERTEAQGAPLACPKCGTDFRAQPTALREIGTHRVARLDMLAVRPDIFDVGGMARYMRGFLGIQTGLIEYPVAPPRLAVEVDAALAGDRSYRPAIACAVMRNLRLDHERIKLLMNLQEDLHWALGRDRKLASIGVYDLEKLAVGGAFRYRTVAPDELRFVPLGFSLDNPADQLTPREILARHKTGIAYAHLLSPMSAYPLLTDAAGAVLSMPPIINGESSRVTQATRHAFVDVTGLAQRTVDRALNILLSGMKEVCPELELEAVRIRYPERQIVTPDFTPAPMTLAVATASETIGVDLDAPSLTKLLERMGHGVTAQPGSNASGPALSVRVPAWRNDIMHPVDLIEDAAVAYGYDKLVPGLVATFTVGVPRAIEEQSALARRVFTGLGFHQVMTLPLTSEPAAFEKWNQPPHPRVVRIANPISSEQTICRVSLWPGLLETLSINKQYDLPQHIFEIGDISLADEALETGAGEQRTLAAAMVSPHAGLADIRAVLDAFVHEMDASIDLSAALHSSLIPGRSAKILAGGREIGWMGELHPEIIERYGLRHAVALMELDFVSLLTTVT